MEHKGVQNEAIYKGGGKHKIMTIMNILKQQFAKRS